MIAGSLKRAALRACLLAAVAVGAGGCPALQPSAPPPASAGARPDAAPPKPPQYFVYEVRRGDTLFTLGQRFGVDWRQIAEANAIASPHELKVGRPLVIPRRDGVEVPDLGSGPAQPAGPAPRRPVSAADLHRGDSSSALWWPTRGRLARRYGAEVRGLAEPGIGIATLPGTEVCAVADGTVVTAMRSGPSAGAAWGSVVAVAHAGGRVSWYAHLETVLVAAGERVRRGQPIGTAGQVELAFRLYKDERPIDPLPHLP